MKFNKVVEFIGTIPELRRVASANVVDHRNLSEEEMREAIIKVKPQYVHFDTVHNNIETAFHENNNMDFRTLSQIIICDILLHEDGFILKADETVEKVMAIEQRIVNKSNEISVSELASRSDSQRQKDLELYYFVLGVAWEYQNSKSPDEVNLLRKLRKKLHINEWEHVVMEAKLGKFPKPNNELHTRGEIRKACMYLQSLGLLFPIRLEEGTDMDVIPEELAEVMKKVLGIEIKEPNYNILIRHKLVCKKTYLKDILNKSSISLGSNETLETLVQKCIQNIKPSFVLDNLDTKSLHKWCTELKLMVSGTKQERIERIISYYDSLRQTETKTEDERAVWYEMFEELAIRNYSLLRAHHIISKDIEVESKFEQATAYLFQEKLKNTPLKQIGVNHPDGLLSLKDMYVMWDNKSKEKPGLVSLKEHIKQFHEYMEKSDKPVPIFLVIAPGFTEDSEIVASKYTAEHLGRNVVLITAKELKELAEKWSSEKNKKRDQPFPLGMFARTGRFDSKLILF